jgi:hypothetical protein
MNDENIKLNFAILCDYAFFSEGGKLNIIGIFKNISPVSFPYSHPQMFVTTNILVKTDGEHNEIIKLVRDGDEVDIMEPLNIKLNVLRDRKDSAELGFLGQLNGIKFEKEGKYIFKIYMDGVIIGEIPLEVSALKK